MPDIYYKSVEYNKISIFNPYQKDIANKYIS